MRTPAALKSDWIKGLITWLTCTLTGWGALMLAAPTAGHISPLHLASGLALGLVLGWGRAMIPAVGLGAAAVVVLVQLTGTPDLSAVPGWILSAQALITGLGASTQAWLAARLTQGGERRALTLEKPGSIVRFLFLAGPVASVVNALISVSGMVALGRLTRDAAPGAALDWWAGDTLGVLMGTPMMLTLVGQPKALWRARRSLVGAPLLISTVLLAAAIRQVQWWETDRETETFNRDVVATANAVKLRLTGYLDALEAVRGVYVASETVTRDEFRKASAYWLDSLEAVQAMGWNERVSRAQLGAFEAQQRAEGVATFQVFDSPTRRGNTGRDDLLVVRFIEPAAGNLTALGYNVLSEPGARQAYERALLENRAMASPGIKLVQETGDQTGIVVYRPVYSGQPETAEARIQAARGVVFMALRMDDAVAAMLQGHPDYLAACLMDGTGPDATLLGGPSICHAGQRGQRSAHRRAVALDFGGRRWELVVWAASAVPAGGVATSWLLAFGGVAFAAALGTLLLVMTGHARRIEAARDEARAQRAAAEEANRAKSAFLSRMSHELRTPLNAVLGFAQVMELDPVTPLPDPHRARLRQIQQAGWHLLDLIDDVLDISRLDTGTLRLNTGPLPVRTLISHALEAIREQAARQGIHVNAPQDIPARWGVHADAIRVRQIMGNLLGNAIKYNRHGGTVTLTVRREETAGRPARVVIAVQDTGMGMSPAQLAQLFQPFNRLGREKDMPDGTGIGLAISRHLAVMMGGQLEAVSQEEQGSTFTLTLPATDVSAPASGETAAHLVTAPAVSPARPVQAVATGAAARLASGSATAPRASPAPASAVVPPGPGIDDQLVKKAMGVRHVLYVEDNFTNSEVIRAALGARPWVTLTVAPTIEEGLAVLHDRLRGPAPDLILLDVHLPDASGIDFLKLVKANPGTEPIPVIMISADALPEQIDAALSAGACCYLTKPVQLTELLRQVDELLTPVG